MRTNDLYIAQVIPSANDDLFRSEVMPAANNDFVQRIGNDRCVR